MAFYNESQTLGVIINYMNVEVTGSLFMTMLAIVILLIALGLMFRVPLEYTIAYIMPVLIVFMAYTGEFLAIGGVALIYLAIIFARLFFIK